MVMVSFMVRCRASARDVGSVVKVAILYCNRKHLNGSVFQLNTIFQ